MVRTPYLRLMAWIEAGAWRWGLLGWGQLLAEGRGGTGFDFSYCPIPPVTRTV